MVVGPLAARGVCTSVCVCVFVVTNIVGQHTHTDTPRLCCNFFFQSPLLLLPIARTCYNCVCVFQFLLSLASRRPSLPSPLFLMLLLALITCSQCHKIFACSAAFYTLQFPYFYCSSSFFHTVCAVAFAVLLWHLACGTYRSACLCLCHCLWLCLPRSLY